MNLLSSNKFWREFRADHPETIGETDTAFDLSNYAEWIDEQLESSRAEVAALRAQLAERRAVVPEISREAWEDLQRRHRSPIGAITHEEILHAWICRHVKSIAPDEGPVKRAVIERVERAAQEFQRSGTYGTSRELAEAVDALRSGEAEGGAK